MAGDRNEAASPPDCDAASLHSVAPALGPGATGVLSYSELDRALVRHAGEQRANLALAVAAVAAEGADRGELACLGPPRNGLGVDAEHRRDLGGRKQRLCVCGSGGHQGNSVSRRPVELGRIPMVKM